MADDRIASEADRLREAKALGRSDVLPRMFDFLVERSLADAPPKEVEIAIAVFGKTAAFDMSQDASVRVYVHRLRKKLDEFYADDDAAAGRLAIPKGEYRIVFETPRAGGGPLKPRWSTRTRWLVAGLAALLLNGLIWASLYGLGPPGGEAAEARAAAPWSQVLRNGKQTILVVGDYYIFDEIDPATGADRLVREYAINSARDLSRYLMRNPGKVGVYKDLGLSYLPVGAALALRDVIPVLTPGRGDRDQLRVVVASALTPEMLKQNNIVYVGYLSGLGLLRDPVFAGSRFTVGDTYDELIDETTRQNYVSQEGGPEAGGGKQQDFGYFSTFAGPSGNRVIIIAGTRDTALMQIAEAVTSRAELRSLSRSVGRAPAFEALYAVEGIRRMNLGGRRLLASPLRADRIWSAEPSAEPKFPEG
ncbi:MAG: hypothetical protein JWP92_1825 [Caulobacter sp.]|nr:hypothetical protein [Caulobacter sp.]